MNNKEMIKRMKRLKKEKVFDECFSLPWFNVCPISESLGIFGSGRAKSLRSAHCVHFAKMTEEEIEHLKSETRKALDYQRPWWKLF